MASRRRPTAAGATPPGQLARYDAADWCADASDVLEAGYYGVQRYLGSRQLWYLTEQGLPERLAALAARDGTRMGPHHAVAAS